MCHPFDFFATGADIALFLVRVDQDLAARQRALGCRCGGRLQVANYPRKSFGIILIGTWFAIRFSFCCAWCRRRTTPPSVRFFGRRRFHAPIFLLLSAVSGRLSGACLGELYDLFGVSERTVRRWRRWWRREFAASAFWRRARGWLTPPAPADDELPLGLLARFRHRTSELIVAALEFLSPLTTVSSSLDVRAAGGRRGEPHRPRSSRRECHLPRSLGAG